MEQTRLMQGMKKLMFDQNYKLQSLEQQFNKFATQNETANSKIHAEAATELATTGIQSHTDLTTTAEDNQTALEIADKRGAQMKDGKSMTKH